MSNLYEPPRDKNQWAMFSLAFWACLFIAIAAVVFAAPVVEVRKDGKVELSSTPSLIGVAQGRRKLEFFVDPASAGAATCGYTPADLDSATAGADTGNNFGPGMGKIVCDKADELFYCINTDDEAVTVNWTDVRLVTATTTPTRTPTNTPTVTPTPA